MGIDEKDLSVREATLAALESSQAGLSELKELFKKASLAFESGDDQGALRIIAAEIIPRIKAFFGFCKTLVDSNADVFSQENAKNMANLFIRSDKVMKELFSQTGAKNYTEVGDLLRFDFNDLLSEYGVALSKVADNFKNSQKAGLDNH